MSMTASVSALLVAALAGPPAFVEARSRTFLMLAPRPYLVRDDRGRPRLGSRLEAPIIQDFFLDAAPGVDGVSIVLDAWTAIDAGDRTLSDRAIGEITEGWLEWRSTAATVRAGRIFLFSETGRGERIDGALAAYRWALGPASTYLTLEGFGGVPVFASYGVDPLLPDQPPEITDPLALAPGGLATDRRGDWIVGARAELEWKEIVDLGAGYTRRTHLAEIDREAIAGRIAIWPLRDLRLSAFSSFDVFGRGIEEAEIALTALIHERVRVEIRGRSRDAALLLPSTSILSVFGGAAHREVGIASDISLGSTVRLSGSSELRQTDPEPRDEARNGYRVSLDLRGPLPHPIASRGAIAIERLRDGWFGGYDTARIAAEIPLSRTLMLSADAGAFALERGSTQGTRGRIALRSGLAGTIDLARAFRLVASVRATKAPGISTETALFGRLEWHIASEF